MYFYPLLIGDWVEVSLRDKTYKGFILDRGVSYAWVGIIASEEDHFHRRAIIVHTSFLKSLEEDYHPDDVSALIDFALEQGDKDWFMYLTSKKFSE